MRKWDFYTTNEIKPNGWTKTQLEIQAEGLIGYMDKVWRTVRDSAWVGGEVKAWESVLYWLDGFIPLAYLLDKKDFKARAKKYVDAIIKSQKPDGWICPCKMEEIPKYDTWLVFLITKVLTVYYECSQDERIPKVIYKALKKYYGLLSNGIIRLRDWSAYRWYEGSIAINFIYEKYQEKWIVDLARLLKKQGIDFKEKTEIWKKPLNKWDMDTHIVNLVMMLKEEAVANEILGEEYTDRAESFYEILSRYNGTPVETFTGDVCLSGLSPIQGTELCSVVEQMYSYEQLYAYTGDPKWAERLEVIAFNAFPATLNDDMWVHQNVQMSNQIACVKFPGRSLFRTNNNEAHLFGLEPHSCCCTANFGQGWPKLVLSSFMYADDTVLNAIPIPAVLTTEDFKITLETEYPFQNTFVYKIDTKKDFQFKIRIPSFAKNLVVNGEKADAAEELNFDFYAGESREVHVSYETEASFVKRPHDLVNVKCGSLVFSLPVKYQKIRYEYVKQGVERLYPYCDYEYQTRSDWNYGYCEGGFEVIPQTVGEIPFSSKTPPVLIKTKAVKIPWDFEDGFNSVCAKVPTSCEPIGEVEEVILYPYGCAKLRMTEMPFIK